MSKILEFTSDIMVLQPPFFIREELYSYPS